MPEIIQETKYANRPLKDLDMYALQCAVVKLLEDCKHFIKEIKTLNNIIGVQNEKIKTLSKKDI